MENIADKTFTGERAEFKSRNKRYENCLFEDGESHLKEGINIEAEHCTFDWKYPLWYGKNYKIENCRITQNGRAGIWYTNNSTFTNIVCEAPKCFRECHDIILDNVSFPDGKETLWWNDGLTIKNIKITGDYLCMRCKNVKVDNLHLEGHYSFDSCENLEITNSYLNTKDAFWNGKNIVIKDSTIIGEYFGWNSEDITLINCHVESLQGFCYIKNLTMINCTCKDTNLAFEYCENVNIEINSYVDSIKNPISGVIKVKEVGEIILDDDDIDHSKTRIIVNGKEIR